MDKHESMAAYVREQRAWWVAELGEGHSDGDDARDFWQGIAEDVAERIEYAKGLPDEDDAHDAAHEIADSAVPIYTHDRFAVLVQTRAYHEDVSEYGTPDDLVTAAGWALYEVARRAAFGIFEALRAMDDAGDFDGSADDEAVSA